nr:hypothetical protein Iba_chr05aCG8110 [Ipomoea batatas]
MDEDSRNSGDAFFSHEREREAAARQAADLRLSSPSQRKLVALRLPTGKLGAWGLVTREVGTDTGIGSGGGGLADRSMATGWLADRGLSSGRQGTGILAAGELSTSIALTERPGTHYSASFGPNCATSGQFQLGTERYAGKLAGRDQSVSRESYTILPHHWVEY